MRTGRPKIDDKLKKSKLLKIRVSLDEHKAVKSLAESRGVSVSNLLRYLIKEVDQDAIRDAIVDELSNNKSKPTRSVKVRSSETTT